MKAYVLSGGYSTRLRPYSEIIPKTLISVAGKPFLRWTTDKLQQDFTVAVLVSEEDYDIFLHEFRGEPVTVVPSGRLGTAGALYRFKNSQDTPFLIVYGDIIIPSFSYKSFSEEAEKIVPDGGAVLLATETSQLPWGIITEEDAEVKFEEKPEVKLRQWTGVALIHNKTLDDVTVGKDWGHNIFPKIPLKVVKTDKEILHLTSINDVEPIRQKMRELKASWS